ncbi:MAG: DNA/RNA non-specific endonuclease [Clostridia bacterium]|nr:DNA/RNA non-specific endonuclease [Clostridia bacterium]
MKKYRFLLLWCAILCLLLCSCGKKAEKTAETNPNETPVVTETKVPTTFSLKDVPAFDGDPFVAVNDNQPYFTDEEKQVTGVFEDYAPLDDLGRCGVTYACVGKALMPTEKRGDISSVKPTGWRNRQYDFVDGKSLYNRCHLIGYQLSGENANNRNLITGTRYMNVDGMLPFENMVADYVKETNGRVLYRVTPIFDGDNLLADGVLMEAFSLEDKGDSVCYCVFCYNVQPGVILDYKTGENRLENEEVGTENGTYVLNTLRKKFHKENCESVNSMNPKNRKNYTGSRQKLIDDGYAPCGSCNP